MSLVPEVEIEEHISKALVVEGVQCGSLLLLPFVLCDALEAVDDNVVVETAINKFVGNDTDCVVCNWKQSLDKERSVEVVAVVVGVEGSILARGFWYIACFNYIYSCCDSSSLLPLNILLASGSRLINNCILDVEPCRERLFKKSRIC